MTASRSWRSDEVAQESQTTSTPGKPRSCCRERFLQGCLISCCLSRRRCRSRTSRLSAAREKPPPEARFRRRLPRGSSGTTRKGSWDAVSAAVSHQITSPEIDAGQFAAFEAARIAFPTLQIGDPPSEPEPLSAAITVAEVAVHLAEISDEAIEGALDEAVEFVADVQRAYGALSWDPVQIVNRARLPALGPVPGAHRHPSVCIPMTGPEEPKLDFVMPRAPKRREYMTAPSKQSPARWTLKQLSDVMTPVLKGPFRHAHESWRNASVALSQGDYSVAAILTGVTCEQTIRALLLCLLWEEEANPAEAAESLI